MLPYKDTLCRIKIHQASKSYSFLKSIDKQTIYYNQKQLHRSGRNSACSFESARIKKVEVFDPVLPYEEPADLAKLKVTTLSKV